MFGMGTGVAPPLESPEGFVAKFDQITPSKPGNSRTVVLNSLFRCHGELTTIQRTGMTVLQSLQISNRVNLMVKPHDRLVLVSSMRCRTSTPSLSTWWSSRGLQDPCGSGYLISGRVSRLYAFSAYPIRTWLSSYALGRTTGAPEVRPSRSSRTKDSTPQISCAHHR